MLSQMASEYMSEKLEKIKKESENVMLPLINKVSFEWCNFLLTIQRTSKRSRYV